MADQRPAASLSATSTFHPETDWPNSSIARPTSGVQTRCQTYTRWCNGAWLVESQATHNTTHKTQPVHDRKTDQWRSNLKRNCDAPSLRVTRCFSSGE